MNKAFPIKLFSTIVFFGSLTHFLMKEAKGKIMNTYYLFALTCVIIQMSALSRAYLYASMGILTISYFISISALVVLYEILFHDKKITIKFILGLILAFISIYMLRDP